MPTYQVEWEMQKGLNGVGHSTLPRQIFAQIRNSALHMYPCLLSIPDIRNTFDDQAINFWIKSIHTVNTIAELRTASLHLHGVVNVILHSAKWIPRLSSQLVAAGGRGRPRFWTKDYNTYVCQEPCTCP